LKNQESYLEKA